MRIVFTDVLKEEPRRLGFVYVMTTKQYEPCGIFKIGFSINLKRRLKQFNATRIESCDAVSGVEADVFFCVRSWKTLHYSELEAFIHEKLHKQRMNNEFFATDIETIDKTVNSFVLKKGSLFFNHDIIWLNAEKFKITRMNEAESEIFLFEQDNILVQATKDEMTDIIISWLKVSDKHNLLQFMSDDGKLQFLNVLRSATTNLEKRLVKPPESQRGNVVNARNVDLEVTRSQQSLEVLTKMLFELLIV